MKLRSLRTSPASGEFCGIVFFLILGFLALSARAQTPTHYEPTLESLNRHPLPQWYADAKLGIFVHWGLYSVPGWAPLVHPEHDFRTPDYIKNNPYAEWYLNVMSIAERYSSRQDYLRRYENAIDSLVKERWLLKEDRAPLLARGSKEWDEATK